MEGRVAIVTGASSGMGEALTRELVSKNWIVAMADLHENPQLSQDLRSNAKFYQTDVADYESQAKTFHQVFQDFGRIDALCANAGIVDRSSIYILDARDEDADTIPPAPDLICTDVDYKGVVYGTQLAIHFMRKNSPRPGGAIVATASIAGVHPHPTYPEYCGAKAGVIVFAKAIAGVLKAKENIRINTVCPGIVSTPIIPAEVVAVQKDFLTPVKTVVDAYVKLLEDPAIFGEAIECSATKHFLVPQPPMCNGSVTRRAVTVWEPLFKSMHHEISGLEDAIA
ncbi:uncharacterized protein MYCFIDRAFT_65264 [Pseudocercospora fijiensis CIRAD86]|uniref:Uncharacterized protein n=1 Tax=Pseudocercospora fijiensis (strain CIRAD86) TaxID=383855 RepID=M3A616_PSEFD|nr:uncharacterized protein MYCFIDRAFT_65264 [Pseudocercospora fijiensis CIRAD86]EME86559.1 hypothetical protein MYCFIDRAFT_65264 [Pseudocercospora fijiensis CIRAD86]